MTIEQAMNPTIEEAIQRLEGMVFTSDLSPNTLRAIAVNKMSLAALRECAERREGCVFCGEKRHHIREAFDDGTAQIIEAMNNYALSIETPMDATTSSVFPIHYCPMCGRKLERSDT